MNHLAVLSIAMTALLLGGCTSAPASERDAPAAPIVITDPRNYDGYAGQPPGALFVHDYWQGQASIVLLQKSTPWRAAASTTKAAAGPHFFPGDDRLVPPGTKWVNATIDTKDLRTSSGKVLFEIFMSDGDTRLPVPADGRISFEARPESSDREHQVLSAWSFRLLFEPEPSGPYNIVGDVHVKVEIARGHDLVPRPDPLRTPLNETRLALKTSGSVGPVAAGVCVLNCPPTIRAKEPIPLGTKVVVVKLGVTQQGSTSVSEPGLLYHAADSRTWISLAPHASSGAQREYRIEVDSHRASDSPFAERSQWEFRLLNSKPQGNNYADGYDYQLEATAHPGPV